MSVLLSTVTLDFDTATECFKSQISCCSQDQIHSTHFLVLHEHRTAYYNYCRQDQKHKYTDHIKNFTLTLLTNVTNSEHLHQKYLIVIQSVAVCINIKCTFPVRRSATTLKSLIVKVTNTDHFAIVQRSARNP